MDSLFFVALMPPSELSEIIDNIRKQCSIEYHVFRALKVPVHMTMAPPFKIDSKIENKMIASLKEASNFDPFDQYLKNYGTFPEHTLYIQGDKTREIVQLHNAIKTCLRPYLSKIYGPITPHITIAYKDIQDSYSLIKEAYKTKQFDAQFRVNKFTLLKHDRTKWNIHKEYEFRQNEKQLKILIL